MHPFLIVTAHRYTALSDLKARRDRLLRSCREANLKGVITLSPEGIDMHVAGEAGPIERLIDELRQWPGLTDLTPNVMGAEHQTFVRMIVRVKHQIGRLARLDDIDPGAQWTQCARCRHPLTPQDMQHAYYLAESSCPYCHRPSADEMAARIASRHAQLDALIQPLPGSVPHDHFRPIGIPPHCDGLTLLEALCRIVTHVPEVFWRERCAQGLLLDDAGQSAPATRRVRAGERYRHRFPAVVEPDVNMRLRVLHEDEALLVIDKPAPLPMHVGGRFVRNTLKFVLDALYAPQTPRPSHRLDANTTGVLVAARTQFFAGKIQTQFARGDVEKIYLTRVHGHPAADVFECEAPIATEAGHAGSRIIDHESGQAARTAFKVRQRLRDGTTLLEAQLYTGRTNQIRVHLWHLGFPVCGDPVYLRNDELGDSQTLPIDAPPLCLHAWRIAFRHPLHGERCEFTAPPPPWFA